MAYHFAMRARKVAWSQHDEKDPGIVQIRRVGTDSTLNDDDDNDDCSSISTTVRKLRVCKDPHQIKDVLTRDGCVIIEDFTDLQTLNQAGKEAAPWITAYENQTKPANPLIKQSPTLRNTLFANKLYQQLCTELLSVDISRRRSGVLVNEICPPILSSISIQKLPVTASGSSPTRYDMVLGTRHEQANAYEIGRDSMLGLIIPTTETVRVDTCLGSHLYDNDSPVFDKDIVQEEIKPGQALIVLGSLYYQILAQQKGHQRQEVHPSRICTIWSSAGVYRSEEQYSLEISAAELESYPDVVRERLR